jgi:hypothetical protein
VPHELQGAGLSDVLQRGDHLSFEDGLDNREQFFVPSVAAGA